MIMLPAHVALSIEYHDTEIDGEPIQSWLQQLGATALDFLNEEDYERVLETRAVWILHWEDDRDEYCLMASTIRGLIECSVARFPDHLQPLF